MIWWLCCGSPRLVCLDLVIILTCKSNIHELSHVSDQLVLLEPGNQTAEAISLHLLTDLLGTQPFLVWRSRSSGGASTGWWCTGSWAWRCCSSWYCGHTWQCSSSVRHWLGGAGDWMSCSTCCRGWWEGWLSLQTFQTYFTCLISSDWASSIKD